jgi:hypothetical protein
MNLIGRVEKLLKQVADAGASEEHPYTWLWHTSEEDKRRLFVEMLAKDCPEAFGPDDRLSDRAYLETLMLHELCEVWRDMMRTLVERAIANGELDWFKALPVDQQINRCRQPRINGREMDRLKREWEERQR